MSIFLTVLGLIGLLIFTVGAILHLLSRPARPANTLIMVIGGLIFAIATEIAGLIALF